MPKGKIPPDLATAIKGLTHRGVPAQLVKALPAKNGVNIAVEVRGESTRTLNVPDNKMTDKAWLTKKLDLI